MNHHGIAKLVKYDGDMLYYAVQAPPDYLVARQGFETADIQFWDSRRRTPEQNALIHALIADIAFWAGYGLVGEAKAWLKYTYIEQHGGDYFSMSDCSVTTARHFAQFLIDFCALNDIPLLDINMAKNEETDAFLYACLVRRKCCVCWDAAEPHHVDRVGAGRNRDEIIHLGMRLMALCRRHHAQAHKIGQKTFEERYKVYGISADEEICRVYGLKMG